MHYDGLTAVTPLHGNILDADGKYRAKATEQAVAEEVGVVMCAPQFLSFEIVSSISCAISRHHFP